MSDYTPISCDFHSELELIALRRKKVVILLGYEKAKADRMETTIEDLYTRDKVEYARLGNGRTIRLDLLLEVDGKPMPPPC